MDAKKIFLIVDDDEDDRELLLEAIKNIDAKVTFQIAVNGYEAFALLQELKHKKSLLPSLIILDLNMPFLDGKDAYEKIRSEPLLEHIPIIVFSSSLNPNDIAFFKKRGIEYISKPSNYKDIHRIAEIMLSAQRD